jgi:hypothetical protein
MPDGLTAEQRTLARDVANRQGATAGLLAALDRGNLTPDDRVALGDLVTDDLAQRGFDDDYEPTDLGRALEDLIDALNALGQA